MSWIVIARCLCGLSFLIGAHPLVADSLYTLIPCRVLDTRTTNTPIQANTTALFAVGGICGVPVEATAVACNTTLLPQGIAVDLGMFPGDLSAPTNTNVVSAGPSSVVAGFAAAMPLSNDGQASVGVFANSSSSGTTHMILDVTGYYMPDSFPSGWPGPTDDPGLSDNPNVAYTDSLGQQSGGSGQSPSPLVPGQGGAGSHYFVSSSGRVVPLVGVSADNACHFN